MTTERPRERDLVLTQGEYAYVLDETKGNVNVYVGSTKVSLSTTDQPVVYDENSGRFVRTDLGTAINAFPFANEGSYIVLKNPSLGEDPKSGANDLPRLDLGRKINIPGPSTFPLWPKQTAEVIEGHHLRSNQYLLVRVYDEESAKKNWGDAVIKPKVSEEGETGIVWKDIDQTMGRLLIIKGTQISFYIPPTGIEVVKDDGEYYIREAVTLERLEYCILLGENGDKRYIQGPDVVFPEPTETFIYNKIDDSRKFRAIELNEISGLYVKVIAPYSEKEVSYKPGDELFITGKDQMIYFPRTEHALIKYGNREKHYGIAIPAGEGRYVLNRLEGNIRLEMGPKVLLCDPRKEVIVRRILKPKVVNLWFPGNEEAIEHNEALFNLANNEKEDESMDFFASASREMATNYVAEKEVAKSFKPGDEFKRGQTFTPPRTITFNNKYDGAIGIEVWTGYAVLVVSKTGSRKVVVGPKPVMLEYDESLEVMELSTGTPKSNENLIKTVYLRVKNNKVSDKVKAETKDLCQVEITLSYKVNFEGDSNLWFDVENYIKFLTDHLRSILRNVIKKKTIEEFYSSTVDIIRDTVLGIPSEKKERPGRKFPENGMIVYDVEILDIEIEDGDIYDLLANAQHEAIEQIIEIKKEQKKLEMVKEKAEVEQNISLIEDKTREIKQELVLAQLQRQTSEKIMKEELEQKIEEIHSKVIEATQKNLDAINIAQLERSKKVTLQEIGFRKDQLDQELLKLQAGVQATVDQVKAISPDLISALQAFSDRDLAGKMAETMSPMALLGGKSVADVLSQLLKGTVIENVLKKNKK